MKFNALEIIEMAKKIERNGAAFYKLASEKVINPEAKQLLNDLASMEQVHEMVFEDLKNYLPDDQAWTKHEVDTDGQLFSYLESMADNIIYDLKNDKMEEHIKSIEAIFKYAIEKEKQSVLYYLGIKELVPEALGKDKISEIIKEEMKHVAILSDAKKKYL
ncbi:MAG: ferritin family protein [Candidatus Muiribacteriota bacterium]